MNNNEEWITMNGTHILCDKNNKERSIELFLNKHNKSLFKTSVNKTLEKITQQKKNTNKKKGLTEEIINSLDKNNNLKKVNKDGFTAYFDKEGNQYTSWVNDNTLLWATESEQNKNKLNELSEEIFNKKWANKTEQEKNKAVNEALKNDEKINRATYASYSTIKNLR